MSNHPQHPDIVFIVLDTVRADRLSCYGHATETTPHLDAFAEKGVLFERAISPAQWTIPAHGSLFTGEQPSAHGTTQIYDKHSAAYPTLAEHLSAGGYRTAGFCNNPLLGIVENDLDRGFQEFYNYGGVLPNRPDTSGRRADRFQRAKAWLQKQISRFNGPIQSVFTRDNALLNFVLQPWLVAMWERNINFKGNTHQSIQDVLATLIQHRDKEDRQPILIYLNLMETHLPYRTPPSFSRKFAPTYHHDREARAFMRAFNYRTYDWIAPIREPFAEAQHRVLNEMYNAEVAYEDHLLQSLLSALDRPAIRDNTMVIITSDHGEGLDHHHYIGHSLVVYEDLVRVPLIVRYPPGFPEGKHVDQAVSTRRIFHTILEAAGVDTQPEADDRGPVDTARLSLLNSLNGQTTVQDPVWAEAYPPITLVRLIEQRNPEAVKQFGCRAVRRTIYEGSHKLVTVDDAPCELFDVSTDPAELENRIAVQPELTARLHRKLDELVTLAKTRGTQHLSDGFQAQLASDKQLSARLRRLGYIE